MKLCLSLVLLATGLPLPALCDNLYVDTSLGLIATTGNTNTHSGNFKLATDYQWATAWENAFTAVATNAGSSSGPTAEMYTAGDKLSYHVNPTDYVFGDLNYLSDRFAGVVEIITNSYG